jgi:hypothetical protein
MVGRQQEHSPRLDIEAIGDRPRRPRPPAGAPQCAVARRHMPRAGTTAPYPAGSRSRPGARRARRAACPGICSRPGHAADAAAGSCRAGHRPTGDPRVPRHRTFQARQPFLQLSDPGFQPGVPRLQVRVLGGQHRDQLPLRRDQPIAGGIQRHRRHRQPFITTSHPQARRHAGTGPAGYALALRPRTARSDPVRTASRDPEVVPARSLRAAQPVPDHRPDLSPDRKVVRPGPSPARSGYVVVVDRRPDPLVPHDLHRQPPTAGGRGP